MKRPLTYRYDEHAEAVYIYIGDTEWRVAAKTIPLGSGDDANADLDQRGKLIGVEILGVAEPVVQLMGGKKARPRQDTL
jgi:uncharacterized protein YuzE